MTEAPFRTPAALAQIDETIYRNMFAGSPNAYLVLTPDMKIINGNDAFVSATNIRREVFAGKHMFDAFPDSSDPANTGVRELYNSFNRALASQQPDTLSYQRYDVQNAEGIWERRIWDGTSWTVADDRKLVTALVLYVKEYKSTTDVEQLLSQALDQVEQSNRAVQTSQKLVREVERLAEEVKCGRLSHLATLREMLAKWPVSMH